MALTLNDVKRVAHLARIAISDAEAQSTHTQLSGIFELIAQMEAVDVSTIAPMSHAQDVVQRNQSTRAVSGGCAAGRCGPLPGAEGHRIAITQAADPQTHPRAEPGTTAAPAYWKIRHTPCNTIRLRQHCDNCVRAWPLESSPAPKSRRNLSIKSMG